MPTDTSIYTVKDFRFGCGQPFYYEHFVDINYQTGSSLIHVSWNWDMLVWVEFKNPYNGVVLAHFEIFTDSTHFIIPASLEKLVIGIQYDGYLNYPSFDIVAPNGGETLISGTTYVVIWWKNFYYPPIGKLEFTTDAGKNWILISDTIPSNPNAYNYYDWSIPSLNSDSCLVRVGEYPCYCDMSDSFFKITYPVRVENEDESPEEFFLYQNYPNPFNPTTSIQYAISSRQLVSLKVYDVLGNEVATLVNEEKPSGEYEVEFDAEGLPSGVYFYQMKAGSFVQTRKMVLVR